MAIALYLMELTAYDITGASVVTLRYSSPVGFITGGSETPASATYDPRLIAPMPVKRDLFEAGATSGHATVDLGFVELQNADGELDDLLTYGYGRQLVLRRGTVGAAYPAGFTTIYDGTALSVEGNGERLTVKLRSLQLDLEQPFQATKYDGDNVAPDGLEGGPDDLLGKPKPVCYGSVLNVEPPCVNTSRLIYQINDGAVNSVDRVSDAGVALNQGLIWESIATGRSGTYRAAAYGGGVWVIAGNAAVLASSPDQTTWTARTSQFTSDNIRGLAYGAGVFVAVGEAGKISSSSDGATWTARTSGFGATNIIAVTFGGGQFVAVGSSGKVSTSSDGSTWTAQTPISGTPSLVCVAYGDGLYVAATGASGGQIYTSPDGATWTARLTTFPVYGFIQFAYGNAMWVGLGTDSTGLTALLVTSIDGVTWIKSPATFVSGVFPIAVSFGVGSFVAMVSAFKVATSVDGVDWTLRDNIFSSTSTSCVSIIYDGTGYFAAGADTYVARATLISYADTTELEDETLAPAAGQFIACPSAGYIRLGSPPFGQVTADVTQGANDAARTQAQLAALVLQRAGKSAGTAAGDYVSGDLTALDSADSSVRGIWVNEETTFSAVLDELMGPGSAWYLDRQGRYRLVQFTAPSGSPTFTITENDIRKGGIVRVTLSKDGVSNVPTWRTKVQYAKNYTVQTSGLAGAVSDSRRAFLAQEYREAIDDDTAVQTPHPLAIESIYPSTIQTAASAATEAARLQTLRGTLRHCFDVTVSLNDYPTVDLNDVGTLQHSRYGLSAGVLHRVIGVHPDAAGEWVTLRLWR